MKYTFRSEKELQGVIQASTGIPQKVINNAKYHIGLVEECFEDGACGNFHILTDEELMNDYAIQHNIKEKRQKEREEYIKKSQQYILNKTLENVPRCPTCNSTKVEKISATKRLVSTGLFGLASSNIGKTMYCKNCGYKW